MHSHSQQYFLSSSTTGRSQQPFPASRCFELQQLPEHTHVRGRCPRGVRAGAGARGHRSPRARVTAAPQAHAPGVEALADWPGVEALAGAWTGEEHVLASDRPDVEALADWPDVEALAGAWAARWRGSAGVEAQRASWEASWRAPPPASVNQGIWHTRCMELLREGCHARHALTTSSPGDWPRGGRRPPATTPRTISCHRGSLA